LLFEVALCRRRYRVIYDFKRFFGKCWCHC